MTTLPSSLLISSMKVVAHGLHVLLPPAGGDRHFLLIGIRSACRGHGRLTPSDLILSGTVERYLRNRRASCSKCSIRNQTWQGWLSELQQEPL